MASIINLVPTTELEAVNSMLSAIGEAPISGDPAASTHADVAMALNLLRNCTREVQSMGWRFNMEYGYELGPFAEVVWEDTAGVSTTLNIFKPDTKMIRFDLTVTSEQASLDLIVRPSRAYLEAGQPVLVFYDRSLNRDGLDKEKFPFLYINPVWLFNFEQMPEECRRYCTVRAARQFCQQIVGSPQTAAFTQQDEMLALRNLKRSYGEEDDYNMLAGNMAVLRHLGNRPLGF